MVFDLLPQVGGASALNLIPFLYMLAEGPSRETCQPFCFRMGQLHGLRQLTRSDFGISEANDLWVGRTTSMNDPRCGITKLHRLGPGNVEKKNTKTEPSSSF